ncbi:MAG: hypothetical protein UW69_C0008G0001, partial [Microgenomates group bacterium GW2011_GWA2_44_7]
KFLFWPMIPDLPRSYEVTFLIWRGVTFLNWTNSLFFFLTAREKSIIMVLSGLKWIRLSYVKKEQNRPISRDLLS